jgi:hypothetical protein
MEKLAELVNANVRLVWRGRYVNTTFLVEIGETAWLVDIREGCIVCVKSGPLVMPRWTFALRASRETWAQFWLPEPQPGFHDVFALVKRRLMRIEGDVYPLMSNLLYFKDVFATLRGVTP